MTTALRRRQTTLLSGMGAYTREQQIVGSLIQQVSSVYAEANGTLKAAIPPVKEFAAAYQGYRSQLAKIGTQAFIRSGGFMGGALGAVTGGIQSVKAVTGAVEAAKKQGVDINVSKEAYLSIQDALLHTDSGLQAFRKITLGNLVSIGVITSMQASTLLGRAGFDARYFKPGDVDFETLVKSWAKKVGSGPVDVKWIDVRWREYDQTRSTLVGQLQPLARSMGFDPSLLVKEDPELVNRIKTKLLDEMKKAHDQVKARQKPEGWLAANFNRAVEVMINAPWLLIFGVAGVVFGHFMAPILKLDAELPRATFAAARLVEASAKIASVGINTYAAAYTQARVKERRSDASSEKAATEAMETAVAKTGKAEYEKAYKDIENYRNYAKVVKDAFEGFLSNLWNFGKWLLIGAVVLVGGGYVLSRAMSPTQRIEVVAR